MRRFEFTLLVCVSLVLNLIAQVDNREHFIHQPTFESTMSTNLDGLVKGYQYTVVDKSGFY